MSTMLCKWVRTKEDWYPTLPALYKAVAADCSNPRNYPAVRVDLIRFPDHTYKVLVQGGDDFGLELEFEDLGEAVRQYDGINQYTTQKILRARGFHAI